MCLKTLWIPEYLSSIRTLKKNDPVPGVRAVCHEHPVRLSKLRQTSQAAFAASSFSSWLMCALI